jgi:hypothetical protein
VAQRRGIRRSSVERAATQYPAAEDRPMKHDPKLFDVICVMVMAATVVSLLFGFPLP